MLDIALLLILLVWFAATVVRAYRLARFYQIDEYKSNRFARWWFGKVERVLPGRSPVITGGAAVFAVLFSEGGPILPAVIWVIAAAWIGWPRPEREVKKRFVATARAKRILGAAFVIAAVDSVVSGLLIGEIIDSDRLTIVLAGVSGYLTWLLAPLWLMLGNIVMTPVESLYRRAYIRLARTIIQRINPTVIGITGSYGKTTTKNFIADLLNARYRAYATPKSFNTMMGICRAINTDLAENYAIDYFIVEMGAYFPGEIARIADLTPPHIGIEVEVGPQHLERFKTLERTAESKYEVIASLPPDGVGVFNWDNPYIRAMQEKGYPATRIGVSRQIDPATAPRDVRFAATDVHESLDGLTFTVHDTHTGEQQAFDVPVLGVHNVTNLLIAIAVCVNERMSLKEIAQRARTLKPAESRLVRQVTAQGITILNDAYSANPVGSRSALAALALHTTGRRVLVTPGMIELGPLHAQENKALGAAAAETATDIVLVGPEQTAPIKAGALEAGFPEASLHTVDLLSEAVAWTQRELKPGDTVLYLNDLPDTY